VSSPGAFSSTRDAALCGVALFVVGLGLAFPALDWPMTFDDLVLFRRFSSAQILASFHGQWDPERLMNWGFRPGSVIFNHVRYSLFGENLAAHRVFLLVLYALYGTLLVPIAARFGLSKKVAAAALALAMCSLYSAFHYVWLTDGNHMVQGVSFALSAALLLNGLDRNRVSTLTMSLFCLTLGLLTREDTFAAIPALLLLGLAAARENRNLRLWLGYSGSVLAVCLSLFRYRSIVVPRAESFGLDFGGWIEGIWKAFNPIGIVAFDPLSAVLIPVWWLLLLASVALAVVHRRGMVFHPVALWLVSAALACTPWLTLRRDDLLLFPVSFAALALAALLFDLWKKSSVGRALAVAMVATCLAGATHSSRVFAENFHPRSLGTIWWNGRYIYGAYAAKATIPRERRLEVKRQLGYAGIRDEWLHLNRTPKLVQRAIEDQRRRPDSRNRFFYPLLPWDVD
jgi:hypothetical protein